ncbi:MAG: hypothetical protein CEN89_602 [Candidatus Berkelbacteria bacterium Licking1014_7]|uniref:Uncharacterized protein n=1 Tax=Candidatus Berkelbacteria bacterium Licking1014_7 TaxID=2017147 RepID=A0A554LI94_9BACT|nr:MAG: hypothetical protein CEN89_602 [Candidatus Berkelbacteria bacterium Licking1014_7]
MGETFRTAMQEGQNESRERAEKMHRRIYGEQRFINVPDLLDNIEQLGKKITEVNINDLENYTENPGDLIHKVGFFTSINEGESYKEYEDWYQLLSGGQPLQFRASAGVTPKVEKAFSAYMTPLRESRNFMKKPWYDSKFQFPKGTFNAGIKGGSYSLERVMSSNHPIERDKSGGISFIGGVAPGFSVIFSEQMKHKIASHDLNSDEIFSLFRCTQTIVQRCIAGNRTYLRDENEFERLRIKIANEMRTVENEMRIENTSREFTIPTHCSVVLSAFYRSLEKNDREQAREAEEIIFRSSPIWDFGNYGVRLTEIKKDKGELKIEPSSIEKGDVKAVIVPIPPDKDETERTFSLVEF